MTDTLFMTQEGLDNLREEIVSLKERRKDVVKHIQEAKEFGDLSENSEYEQAKNEQAFVEGRIGEIEDILRRAKVVSPKEHKGQTVSLGCTVVVDVDGDEETYMIVGATEADPRKGKVSIESPAGKALVGRGKGDVVSVQAPAGKIDYVIKSVTF